MTTLAKPAGSRRGVKPSKYVFTEEQDTILRNYCENLKSNINTLLKNPQDPTRDPKLAEWKQASATEILDLPEFRNLDRSIHSEEGWKQGIVNRFTNYFHNNIKKTLPVGVVATGGSESAETDKLLRTFALLSNDLSGRDYYARKHPKLVTQRSKAIFENEYNVSQRTARNKAISELWDEMISSEKNEWKERAEAYAMDIANNQQNFSDTMTVALQAMVDRGRLGTGIIGLSYAFRAENGTIQTGSVHVGTDVAAGKPISTKVDNPEWQSIWEEHAEMVLPFLPVTEASFVKLDEGSAPIFPELNLKKETPEQLGIILEEYITKLWAKASPANPRSTVLWERLHKEPEMYYDNEKFELPARLQPASQYNNPADLYALVKYFADKQCQGMPFKFTRFNELSDDSDVENITQKSGVEPNSGVEANPADKTLKKKARLERKINEPMTGEHKQQPTLARNLRKRGPTGGILPSTPPKRLADLPEVDVEMGTGQPAKRKKKSGYAYVAVPLE